MRRWLRNMESVRRGEGGGAENRQTSRCMRLRLRHNMWNQVKPRATKCGLAKPSATFPYRNGAPSSLVTRPPAAASTAWPAAMSHSMVRPRRGYKSASPVATRHSFNDEPAEIRLATLYLERNSSVFASRCEREATATRPSAGARRGRTRRRETFGGVEIQRQILGRRQFERAMRAVADEQPRLRRRQHHAVHGLRIFDERDVDRELAVLRNELLGPGQGVDQEKPPADLRRTARGDFFLGDDGGARLDGPQPLQDQLLRFLVGAGPRRFVRFCPRFRTLAVMSEDQAPGIVRGFGQRAGQRRHGTHFKQSLRLHPDSHILETMSRWARWKLR